MGHAFESALIDTLVRYHRMTGRNTLWLPGTDHASIGVSTIIDRNLKAGRKNSARCWERGLLRICMAVERRLWEHHY